MSGKRSRVLLLALAMLGHGVAPAFAQDEKNCRIICELKWKAEPTFTIESLGTRPRIQAPDGVVERVSRERVFEAVLALDMRTRLPRIGFTAEAITAPMSDDNAVQLEFESNFYWLTERMSGGWASSHFDVVDQFSPAERPNTSRAYTHKLDFELDTAIQPFKRLAEDRWLRGVELEASLDYLATGLPKAGDLFPNGVRYLDDASHWSFSFVIVLPVAPF